MVRDGSSTKKSYEKGYHITEMVALTKNENHPISVYSHIHSSVEKNYKSVNIETFKGIDSIIANIKRKCCINFDRGYDSNKIINKMRGNEK